MGRRFFRWILVSCFAASFSVTAAAAQVSSFDFTSPLQVSAVTGEFNLVRQEPLEGLNLFFDDFVIGVGTDDGSIEGSVAGGAVDVTSEGPGRITTLLKFGVAKSVHIDALIFEFSHGGPGPLEFFVYRNEVDTLQAIELPVGSDVYTFALTDADFVLGDTLSLVFGGEGGGAQHIGTINMTGPKIDVVAPDTLFGSLFVGVGALMAIQRRRSFVRM